MVQDGLLPLYEQVRRKILSEIEAGRLAEGSFLPPELELCATYGVSRITLRRAVGELCAEGLLLRQQRLGLPRPRRLAVKVRDHSVRVAAPTLTLAAGFRGNMPFPRLMRRMTA